MNRIAISALALACLAGSPAWAGAGAPQRTLGQAPQPQAAPPAAPPQAAPQNFGRHDGGGNPRLSGEAPHAAPNMDSAPHWRQQDRPAAPEAARPEPDHDRAERHPDGAPFDRDQADQQRRAWQDSHERQRQDDARRDLDQRRRELDWDRQHESGPAPGVWQSPDRDRGDRDDRRERADNGARERQGRIERWHGPAYTPGHRPDNWDRRPREWNPRDYYHNYRAERRFHWRRYDAPPGWYYQRWSFGQYLPDPFWTRDYWVEDYWELGLPVPPWGCQWVRYGDDALLIDLDSGEILQVIYGIFY